MKQPTLQQVQNELLDISKKLDHLTALLEEECELADDLITDIEASRCRPAKEFITHERMRSEFST